MQGGSQCLSLIWNRSVIIYYSKYQTYLLILIEILEYGVGTLNNYELQLDTVPSIQQRPFTAVVKI